MLAKRTGKGRVAIANPEVERELALLQSRSGSPAAVQALAAAIEERDNYTHEHSEQVVRLARGVAMMLGLPADDVERIAHAALLHDVGKLAMPAELLDKSGPLTSDEWEVMSEHPIVGERILARTKELAGIAPIVRHEHEHWDGTGYPDGLEGQRIPVGSRVILACDAYVAMTTARPYRAAMLGRRRRRRAARRARARSSTPRSSTRCSTCSATHAAGARPLGGRQARRRAAARAYRPALAAGLGTGRVISVAE